jgi:hypothetical protein
MTKKQFMMALFTLAISGFIGGGVTSALFGNGSAFAAKSNVHKTISSEEFVIVGKNGVRLGVLGSSNDMPFVRLRDNKGVTRASLLVTPNDDSMLAFHDEKGNLRMNMFASADGKSFIGMPGKNKGDILMLIADPIGNSLSISIGVNASPRILFSGDNEDTVFSMTDKNGKNIVSYTD